MYISTFYVHMLMYTEIYVYTIHTYVYNIYIYIIYIIYIYISKHNMRINKIYRDILKSVYILNILKTAHVLITFEFKSCKSYF